MASKKNLVTWIFSVLVALMFLAGGGPKLAGVPQVVDNFHKYGFADSFRLFVGAAEVVGAVGLLVPATATLAATGLAVVMAGAVFTHLTHGEGPNALIPAVLLIALVALAKARRGAVASLVGAAAEH